MVYFLFVFCNACVCVCGVCVGVWCVCVVCVCVCVCVCGCVCVGECVCVVCVWVCVKKRMQRKIADEGRVFKYKWENVFLLDCVTKLFSSFAVRGGSVKRTQSAQSLLNLTQR